MVRIILGVSPSEFRAMLPEDLQGLYDELVKCMVQDCGIDEPAAVGIVAKLMVDALRNMTQQLKLKPEEEGPGP